MKLYLPLVTSLVVALAACGSNLCSNEVIAEIPSPDGAYVATVFERNCGATTPFIRVVMLRSASSTLDADRHADWVSTTEGQPTVDVRWLNENELQVTSAGGGRVGTRRTQWNRVRISFK
jgi:hypothetical protein